MLEKKYYSGHATHFVACSSVMIATTAAYMSRKLPSYMQVSYFRPNRDSFLEVLLYVSWVELTSMQVYMGPVFYCAQLFLPG